MFPAQRWSVNCSQKVCFLVTALKEIRVDKSGIRGGQNSIKIRQFFKKSVRNDIFSLEIWQAVLSYWNQQKLVMRWKFQDSLCALENFTSIIAIFQTTNITNVSFKLHPPQLKFLLILEFQVYNIPNYRKIIPISFISDFVQLKQLGYTTFRLPCITLFQ